MIVFPMFDVIFVVAVSMPMFDVLFVVAVRALERLNFILKNLCEGKFFRRKRATMFRSPSRNQRSKGFKIKHSHDKRKAFDESHARLIENLENVHGVIKLGRKDLPKIDETTMVNEKHGEEEENDEEENMDEEVEEEEEDESKPEESEEEKKKRRR
ncbi:hypothetical protein Syun_014528 [Stephania yunnanensis]|uniref:Uncharacterized protein n=1 Tax=Stephania yunnanensis TaxID=152371 RepID=A0AAP0JL80_9MAGN